MDFLQTEGEKWFREYERMLLAARERLSGLKHLKVIKTEQFDLSKIIISTLNCNMTSGELYRILLEKYHLQMEMKAESYVLAMTTVCDSEEGMKRLVEALFSIDEELKEQNFDTVFTEERFPEADVCMTSAEIERLPETDFEIRPWEDCEGWISAEYAYLYPPGIPLLAPGERINRAIIVWLVYYREMGFSVEGSMREGMLKVTGERNNE